MSYVSFEDAYEQMVLASVLPEILGYFQYNKYKLENDQRFVDNIIVFSNYYRKSDVVNSRFIEIFGSLVFGNKFTVELLAFIKLFNTPTANQLLDELLAFIELFNTPTANQLLDDTSVVRGIDISICYVLVNRMCYEIKSYHDANGPTEDYFKLADKFVRVMNGFQPEIMIMGIRIFLTVYALPLNSDLPNWKEFSSKYKD